MVIVLYNVPLSITYVMFIGIEQGSKKKLEINNMIPDNNNNNIMHVIVYEPHKNEVREAQTVSLSLIACNKVVHEKKLFIYFQ